MKRIRFRSLGSLGRAAVDRRLVPFNPFQLDYWLRADQSDPDDQNTQPEEKLIAIIRFCSVSLGRIVYSQDNSAAFFSGWACPRACRLLIAFLSGRSGQLAFRRPADCNGSSWGDPVG